jgi:7-keto-8-aminopelargonate synthetase-like enzyme
LHKNQRNVGILENIVAGMTTSTTRNSAELQSQYAAQVDVLEHLSNKVKSLLAKTTIAPNNTTTATAKIKLERDFERVQSRASALQERVARFQKATAASNATQESLPNSATLNYHEQVQLQLQQDVSVVGGTCFALL